VYVDITVLTINVVFTGQQACQRNHEGIQSTASFYCFIAYIVIVL